MEKYKCFGCNMEFYCGWSDKEMMKSDGEFFKNDEYPKSVEELHEMRKKSLTDILCDDCFEHFKKWFSTLTQEQKDKMKNDK